MIRLRIEPLSTKNIEPARQLLRAYAAFLGPKTADSAGLDEEIASLEIKYVPPEGGFWIAELACKDGGLQYAGCIAFRPLRLVREARACELKRMFVMAESRGAGVGAALLETAMAEAGRQGYTAMYLDTEPELMGSALRLYLRMGFEECEPYRQSNIPGLLFMRASLGEAGHGG